MGLFIVREGHGEEGALPALISRLRQQRELDSLPHVPRDGNWKKPLLTESHVRDVCEQVRVIPSCQALLLTRDADNDELPDGDCPKTTAPMMAAWARGLRLPFPVAVVLFYKEYETLFLAGAGGMAGRDIKDRRGTVLATVPAHVGAHPVPEYPRDAKGWVATHLVAGYKPTLLQTSLTRLLDFDDASTAALSSFRRLVTALTFLSDNLGVAGAVYPPASEVADDA